MHCLHTFVISKKNITPKVSSFSPFALVSVLQQIWSSLNMGSMYLS